MIYRRRQSGQDLVLDLVNKLVLNRQCKRGKEIHQELNTTFSFLSRKDWTSDSAMDSFNSSIYIFTDGSQIEMGTGAGFFCSNSYAEGIFKLNDFNSVFQAEKYWHNRRSQVDFRSNRCTAKRQLKLTVAPILSLR